MNQIIKLTNNPMASSLDTALGVTFKLHVPYGPESVNIMANGNIVDYEETLNKDNVLVGKMMHTSRTEFTKAFELNFTDKNVFAFEEDGRKIQVKLLAINPQSHNRQRFYSCELYVTDETI